MKKCRNDKSMTVAFNVWVATQSKAASKFLSCFGTRSIKFLICGLPRFYCSFCVLLYLTIANKSKAREVMKRKFL